MQDHVAQSDATDEAYAEREGKPLIEFVLFRGVWCVHWSKRVNRLTLAFGDLFDGMFCVRCEGAPSLVVCRE